MDVRFGIDVVLDAAKAIGGLNTLGQKLTGMANPGRLASEALSGVSEIGGGALGRIEAGAAQAEGAWSRLSQTIGMPLELGSIFAAVSGIRSLKDATIGANAAIEMNQVRMTSLLKGWNDSKTSATIKSDELMKDLEKYGKETYFDLQPLVEAATNAAQVSHDPKAVFDLTKLATRLAAAKGTNDPNWATQAIVSALQGNYESLRFSFGINANQEQITAMAARMGGNNATNRYLALKQLIDMRVGKEGPNDSVHEMAKTWNGVANNLTDQFQVPMRDMSKAGFEKLRDALVRLNDALSKFEETQGFKKLRDAMSTHFLQAVTPATKALDLLSHSLDRIPDLLARFGPLIHNVTMALAVIVGVNTAVLALKGGAGLLLGVMRTASSVILPFMGVILNPLVIAGIIGLSAALWPLVKGLDVGGQTVEKRWHGLVQSIIQLDLRAIFVRPLQAIRTFLEQLSTGHIDWGKVLAPNSFLADLRDLARNIKTALGQALVDVFPELTAPLARVQEVVNTLKGWLGSLGVDVPKLAAAAGAVSLLFRALGLGNPWLLAAGAAFKGLSTGIGLVEIAIANPALAAGVAVIAALLSPLLKNIMVFGRSVGEWMDVLAAKVASVNWQNVFAGPLGFLRGMVDGLSSSNFSLSDWLQQAFAPGSILAFFGSLARPIWQGLVGALDQVFPGLHGWFTSTFGNLGQVVTDTFKVAVGVAGPLLDGIMTTIGPTVKAIAAVLLPIVGFAWQVFAAAMHALAEAVQSPGMQTTLKVIGGIAGIVLPLTMLGRVFAALGPAVSGIGGAIRGAGSTFSALRTLGSLVGTHGFGPVASTLGRILGGALTTRFPLLGQLAAWGARLAPFLTRIPAMIAPVLTILGRIGSFFVGGPIGIAVGVVTALVGLGALLYNHWQPFHDLVDSLGARISSGFASAREAGGRFLAWAGGLPARLGATWEALKGDVGAAALGMYNGLHEHLNNFAYWTSGLPTRLAHTWDTIKSAAGDLGSSIYTALTEGIKTWVTNIPTVLSGFMDALPAPLKTALQWVQDHTGGGPAPTTPAATAPTPAPLLPPVVTLPLPISPLLPTAPLAPVLLPAPSGFIGPVAPGAGGAAPSITVHAPLTVQGGTGMTAAEFQVAYQSALAVHLPEAINNALNNTRY